MLEDAERLPAGLDRLAQLDSTLAEADELARLHLAQQLGADDVEGAALGRDAVAVTELTEREWAEAGAVAEREHALGAHDDRREGTLEPWDHILDRVLHAIRLVRRDERGDDLGVRRRPERDLALAQLRVELHGVDQVPVVGKGQSPVVVADDRLSVLPRRRAGRRVADVADRHRARERPELGLVEDLGHEAELTCGDDLPAVDGGDARGLLPAVLQCVQREVRETGDVGLRRVNAEDPAFVARAFAIQVRIDGGHARRSGIAC